MNKQTLINEIESNSFGVASIEKVVAGRNQDGTVTYDEGTLQNGKTYVKYNVNVFTATATGVLPKNIPVIVFNEGEVDEEAYYSQNNDTPQLTNIRTSVFTYLNTLPYLDSTIEQVNEKEKRAFVRVVKDNGNNTASEIRVLIYKDDGQPIKHIELTQ